MADKTRELILRARVYRVFAMIFAACGLLMFVFLYMQNVQGNIFHALADPLTLTILVIPFLPAIVLSWRASSAEKKAAALLESPAKPS